MDDALRFFLPVDVAYHEAEGADLEAQEARQERPIRRRFFLRGGRHFVLSAVPLRWVERQPAGTVVFDPQVAVTAVTDDTYIQQDSESNYSNSSELRIGTFSSSTQNRRALLRFSLAAIPQEAQIESARMQVYWDRSGHSGGSYTSMPVGLYQLKSPWDEEVATWTYASWYDEPISMYPWDTPGIGHGNDMLTEPEDVVVWEGNGENRWMSYDVTALTRRWVSGAELNRGVVLRVTRDLLSTHCVYVPSSESYYTALRPRLVVTYAPTELARYTYTPLGQPDSLLLHEGALQSRSAYDFHGRASELVYDEALNGEELFHATYGYDADGRIDAITHQNAATASGTTTAAYAYDGLGRLEGATATGAQPLQATYAYDLAGNLLARTVAGQTSTYSYASATSPNRLTAVTGGASRSYAYDADGRVTADGLRTFAYDARGQASAVTAHGETSTYLYDEGGWRVGRTGGEVLFDYDFEQQPEEDLSDWTLYRPYYWWVAEGRLRVTASGSRATPLHPSGPVGDFEAEVVFETEAVPGGNGSQQPSDTRGWFGLMFARPSPEDHHSTGEMVYWRWDGEVESTGFGSEQTGYMLR